MKKRRISQNEEAIRGILLIVVFIVGLIFLRDILVKRGVNILMRSPINSPVSRSTRAPLIPEPPTSIPNPIRVIRASLLKTGSA